MPIALLLLLPLFLSGCGASSGMVSDVAAELKRIAGGNVRQNPRAPVNASSDVLIDSLQVPIFDVFLETGNDFPESDRGTTTIYTCLARNEDECMVELVGPQYENLFSSETGLNLFNVSIDNYNILMMRTCERGISGFNVRVKAQVVLGVTTWYTMAGSQYLTTNVGDYGHATIAFGDCRLYTAIETPVSFNKEMEAPSLNLYFDLRDAAVAVMPAGPDLTTSHTCSVPELPAGIAPYLCVEIPRLAPTLSTSVPTVERYRLVLSDSLNSATHLGLIFSEGIPIGGYFRPFFDDSYLFQPPLPGAFKLARGTQASIGFTDYDETNATTISGDGPFTVSDFDRPIVGETSTSLPFANGSGEISSRTFSATRLE